MPKLLRYMGPGYLVGVPARDLEDTEIISLGLDPLELIASGQYVEDKSAETGRKRSEVSDGPNSIS